MELTAPPNGAIYVDSNSVTFKCKPVGLDLIQVRLYTDVTGNWGVTSTDTNPQNNTESSFTINNIDNGDYTWNCKLISGSGSTWGSNRTITVSYTNSPPSFSGPIANQTWTKDNSLTNAHRVVPPLIEKNIHYFLKRKKYPQIIFLVKLYFPLRQSKIIYLYYHVYQFYQEQNKSLDFQTLRLCQSSATNQPVPVHNEF